MNIFVTHANPKMAARQHCYVHVVKMIVEYHQLLSTAHRLIDGNVWAEKNGLCKSTHPNHPSAVWTRLSRKHYRWLWLCAKELHVIYEDWSEKAHKYKRMHAVLGQPPVNLRSETFCLPTPAMPDEFKYGDVCLSYQLYLNHKFKEWRERDRPMSIVFPCGEPRWYEE